MSAYLYFLQRIAVQVGFINELEVPEGHCSEIVYMVMLEMKSIQLEPHWLLGIHWRIHEGRNKIAGQVQRLEIPVQCFYSVGK